MEQLQQIFDCAVEAVMQASGLDFDALANCRSERCVVARVVLVDVLMELGMSEGDISLLSGRVSRGLIRLRIVRGTDLMGWLHG